MYVVQFAQRPNPRAALAKPPRHSVASINTHDMPTFAAHWRGLDIDDRVKLGLLTKLQARNEHARRAKLNMALLKFLQRNGFPKQSGSPALRRNEALIFGRRHHKAKDLSLVTSAVIEDEDIRQILEACLAWLRSGPADLVLINFEDLWGETLPQNVPGTSTERPNWQRKARYSLEEIHANGGLRLFLRSLGAGDHR
jgi:4-alpha-glucanotransferase